VHREPVVSTHETLLNALLDLSGRLVTFMGYVKAHPGAVADFFAVGLLSTRETSMAGVPAGDRVLISVGDAKIPIVVDDIVEQRLARDAELGIAEAHLGRGCSCYIVETRYSILLFQDSEHHASR
jgi:hypothetical protein